MSRFRVFYLILSMASASFGAPAKKTYVTNDSIDKRAQPIIKTTGVGKAIAVWGDQSDGTIYGACLSDGVWTSPNLLESTFFAFPYPPFVEIDEEGNGIILWADSFQKNIRAAFLSKEGDWSEPVSISPLGDYCARVSMTMGKQGHAIAVWFNFSQQTIQSSMLLHKGGTWSEPVTLETDSPKGRFPHAPKRPF